MSDSIEAQAQAQAQADFDQPQQQRQLLLNEEREQQQQQQQQQQQPAPNSDSIPIPINPYEVGERVIASFDNYLYEAKVETVNFDGSWKFKIHYMGWKRSWDECVGVDRLMKRTDENLLKVSRDKKQIEDMKARHLSQKKLATSSDPRGKKLKNDSAFKCRKRKREHNSFKEKDNGPVEKTLNISIPATLRKHLMDDFESIKGMGMLVKLPRTPNVDDIIKKYQDYRRMKDDVMSASLSELLSGLSAYFNKALPVMLLYNEERQQFQEAITENMFPSTVYGAEHLLRLFVKLPALIYALNIEKDTLKDLRQNLQNFLKFLQKNRSVFFLSPYHAHDHSLRSTDKEFN